jgi:hypothetical protein
MPGYLAVLVATIAAFIVGAIWYGPLFGRAWRRLLNVPEGASMGMPIKPMVGGFFATLVMVYVYAVIKTALAITSGVQAAWLAFLLVVGFIGTSHLNHVLYEKRPWKWYWISVGQYAVALIVAALVLAWW